MARIGIVGSVAVDHVVRLADALVPGRHVETSGAELRLGGGGANVALPLAHAGHEVTLLAAVGDDDEGSWLQSELAAQGVDCRALARVAGGSTRSLVLVDPSGDRTAVNLERCADTTLGTRIGELDVEVLYVRTRSLDLGRALEAACARSRVVAHVPPCGAGERPAHVLVGSRSDLSVEWLTAPLESATAAAGPALEWTIVTRGAAGAQAFSRDEAINVPPVPVQALDTTGAGDAFAAGLVHALAGGEPMEAALGVASAWGAASAGQAGSILPSETVARLVGSPE